MSSSTYSAVVLNDNPIAYWQLDETSGTLADNSGSVGNGLDATYSGSPILGAPGLATRDGAAIFDGVNDGVLLKKHNSLNTASSYSKKTIELWFNATDTNGVQMLYEQGGSSNGLNLYLNGSTLNLGAWRSNQGSWLNTNITAGETYHVVLVFDSGKLSGYLNGELIDSIDTGFTTLASHSNSSGIGRNFSTTRLSNGNATSAGRYFAGTIDNVALYNSALSETQVASHYDSRSQTLTGNFAGTTIQGNAGDDILIGDSTSQVLQLDGSNDFVNLGNPAAMRITGNQTIEMWVNPSNFNERRNPFAKAFGGEGALTIEKNGSISYYYGKTGSNSGQSGVSYQAFNTGAGALSLNEWTHIAVVRDFTSKTLSWYINGDLIKTTPTIFESATAGSRSAFIGAGYKSKFAGQLDEVRVWNIARTAEEISASLGESLTGAESGLAGYWNFDQDSSSSTEIKDLSNNNLTSTLVNGQSNHIVQQTNGDDELSGNDGNDVLYGDRFEINQSLNLDGSNDYVNINNASDLNFGSTQNFTVEVWVKDDPNSSN